MVHSYGHRIDTCTAQYAIWICSACLGNSLVENSVLHAMTALLSAR